MRSHTGSSRLPPSGGDNEWFVRLFATLRFHRQMTPGNMPVPDLIERRMLGRTSVPRVGAPIMKATACRPRGWRRNGTRNGRQTLALVTDLRHRVQQAFGVRMMRRCEELAHGRFL